MIKNVIKTCNSPVFLKKKDQPKRNETKKLLKSVNVLLYLNYLAVLMRSLFLYFLSKVEDLTKVKKNCPNTWNIYQFQAYVFALIILEN